MDGLRIDKYLSATHIIKRRGEAQNAADNGKILLNQRIVKPSKEVKIGDKVTIQFPSRLLTIEILDLPYRSIRKDESSKYFRILNEQRINHFDEKW